MTGSEKTGIKRKGDWGIRVQGLETERAQRMEIKTVKMKEERQTGRKSEHWMRERH